MLLKAIETMSKKKPCRVCRRLENEQEQVAAVQGSRVGAGGGLKQKQQLKEAELWKLEKD